MTIFYLYLLLTIPVVFYLIYIIQYSSYKGANDTLSKHSFWIPNLYTIFICLLMVFSSSFWIAFFIGAVSIIGVHIIGFKALQASLADKTGLGVTMFSGMMAMYALSGILLYKAVYYLYVQYF